MTKSIRIGIASVFFFIVWMVGMFTTVHHSAYWSFVTIMSGTCAGLLGLTASGRGSRWWLVIPGLLGMFFLAVYCIFLFHK